MSETSPIVRLYGSGWSLNPSAPSAVYWCDGETRQTTEITSDGSRARWTDPLEALHAIERIIRDSPEPNACAVGFFSYELGGCFEQRMRPRADKSQAMPLFALSVHADSNEPPALQVERPRLKRISSTRPVSRDAYLERVRAVQTYITAGDVFQVNLAQRFSFPLRENVATIAERLQRDNPAKYGALLDYGDFALISNSPELFLSVTPDRRVITRPIKGTRPRGPGMRDALLASTKDQAELAMIVDLQRNDLGRVCEIGTVRVVEPRAIEEHPTVYHGVATIEGLLRSDVGVVELLAATFPCGSVTGAPKIRAMQIIDELEPFTRGPYCGAIGTVSSDGSLTLSVAIRTMIIDRGEVHVSVGGGIVADSVPEDEYEETLVKARAMLRALQVSEDEINRG